MRMSLRPWCTRTCSTAPTCAGEESGGSVAHPAEVPEIWIRRGPAERRPNDQPRLALLAAKGDMDPLVDRRAEARRHSRAAAGPPLIPVRHREGRRKDFRRGAGWRRQAPPANRRDWREGSIGVRRPGATRSVKPGRPKGDEGGGRQGGAGLPAVGDDHGQRIAAHHVLVRPRSAGDQDVSQGDAPTLGDVTQRPGTGFPQVPRLRNPGPRFCAGALQGLR